MDLPLYHPPLHTPLPHPHPTLPTHTTRALLQQKRPNVTFTSPSKLITRQVHLCAVYVRMDDPLVVIGVSDVHAIP